jgi:hypothetical protein
VEMPVFVLTTGCGVPIAPMPNTRPLIRGTFPYVRPVWRLVYEAYAGATQPVYAVAARTGSRYVPRSPWPPSGMPYPSLPA